MLEILARRTDHNITTIDTNPQTATVTAIEPVFASDAAANDKRVSHFRLLVSRNGEAEGTPVAVVEAR